MVDGGLGASERTTCDGDLCGVERRVSRCAISSFSEADRGERFRLFRPVREVWKLVGSVSEPGSSSPE